MTFPALTPPHTPTLLPTRPLSPPSTLELRKCVTGNKCHLPRREEEEGEREDFDCMPVGAGVRNQRFLSFPAVRDTPSEPWP